MYSQKAAKLWGLREMLCVHDLFDDLRDGRVLLRLLELLSSKFLVEPHQSHMRILQLENVSKALRFLCAQGAHIENLGAQDIVDGNPRLTLGLIWTIILHFQVSDIRLENRLIFLRETPANFVIRRKEK
ncbi:Microtubule-actin crosslinking factor 1 [Fasciola hepatica]|uniref:Microtubule-actin crosslinking factor 1 n=1 Tax=Fasciola hepatica TaxID=6192 RepID=A0A4E0R3R8_FASHE|nr:Microtubule-actin crosslinking factor 1 [Fasciola hepatica]